jgi:hypothetical protein
MQLERNVMAFQDVLDRNAEWRPGKLNQREHAGYMNEGIRNFKVGGGAAYRRRAESVIAGIYFGLEKSNGELVLEQLVSVEVS